MAVAGEPGIGKATLIAAACRTDSTIRVLRASCDPLSTPRPLGPFRDLAVEAGYDADLGRDDLMLSEICDHIFRALRGKRAVLVIEDLHWVDAASVDVLRFVARRVSSMALALLVSYRDHEIGPPAFGPGAVGRLRPAGRPHDPAFGRAVGDGRRAGAPIDRVGSRPGTP
ncbi:MAG TPA: AAA family ATPase [Nakamurella sp.]